MSVMNKLICLLTCLAIICVCMVSCGTDNPVGGDNAGGNNIGENNGGNNDGNGDNNKVDDETVTDSYLATVKIVYATNDWKMKDAVDAIGSPETLISVDGDSIKIQSNVQLDDMYSSTEYIYVDSKLYYSINVGMGELFASEYKFADMSEGDKTQLLNQAGAGASIDKEDFADVEITESGKLTAYTCANIGGEAKESLRSIFSSKFASIGATVEVKNVSYYLETINDRNDNSILSCDLIIVMDGVEYSITSHIYYSYDYDAEIEISAPSDITKYKESSLDEIL